MSPCYDFIGSDACPSPQPESTLPITSSAVLAGNHPELLPASDPLSIQNSTEIQRKFNGVLTEVSHD